MKYGNSRKQAVVLFFAFLCLMVFPEFSGAEEGFKPRFSLKLTGGLDYFKWGDVNKSLKSLSDALDPYITRGKINEMNHYKPAWEAEVRMDIAPKLSLGFSASSPIRLENNDHVEYSLHSSQGRHPRLGAERFENQIVHAFQTWTQLFSVFQFQNQCLFEWRNELLSYDYFGEKRI